MKTAISIIVLAVFLTAAVGEIKCIIKFVQCDFKESYKAEAIYGIGIVTGAGVVIGYMDFGT